MIRFGPVLLAILRGLGQAICIVMITFVLCRVLPGDVVDVLGREGGLTDVQQAEMRHALGLDRSIAVQFLDWGRRALAGDLGSSIRFGQPVAAMMAHAAPVTLKLAALSFVVGLVLALTLALVATSMRSTLADTAIDALNIWSIAVPTFCAGVVGILLFSIWLRWLPVIGSFVLPVLIIGIDNAGQIVKLLREELKEAVALPHVRTAHAKGLTLWRVATAYVLPAAAPIVLALSGIVLSGLVAGTLTMEVLFGLPGIGSLLLNAVYGRDYPVILAAVTGISVSLVAINTASDVAHRLIDPRVS